VFAQRVANYPVVRLAPNPTVVAILRRLLVCLATPNPRSQERGAIYTNKWIGKHFAVTHDWPKSATVIREAAFSAQGHMGILSWFFGLRYDMRLAV